MTALSNRNETARAALDACTGHIRWLIDEAAIEGEQLAIRGWAISSGSAADRISFLVNGEPFDEIEYPLSSPDLSEIFWNTPHSRAARFRCRTALHGGDIFRGGFARLEFADDGAVPDSVRRSAWYFPDPRSRVPVPSGERIERVIGTPDASSYLVGGASLFGRFRDYLSDVWDIELSGLDAVLDWGCGSGRLARFFQSSPRVDLWGADIDESNIQWCRQNLEHGTFVTLPLEPPTQLPSGHFDLIIGISVMTHLAQRHQEVWLGELHRATKPGGMVFLSVQGPAQSGLYRTPADILEDVERRGFVAVAQNRALDGFIDSDDYYLDVIQSRRHIRESWGRFFEVLDVLDAIAANQDLVVLRRRP